MTANNYLRETCKPKDTDVVLVLSGSVIQGIEPVIEALAELPSHVHLVGLVRLVLPGHEDELRALAKRLGISDRVHFLPFAPYETLASTTRVWTSV